MSKTINVGRVTAYAEAVAGGYTGTLEEWERDLANLGTTAAEVEANRQAVAEDKAAVEENLTTVESYKNSAVQSAAAAVQSAADAHTDALAATEAKEAAQSAQGIAEEARADAVSAKEAAENAQTGANQSASAAAEAALAAGNAAQMASAGADTATQKAAEAEASKEAAQEAARTLTIDTTLTQTGQAADAKKVGDEITDLKSANTQTINDSIDGVFVIPQNYIEQGAYDADGNPVANNTRIRVKFPVYVKAGSSYNFTAGTNAQQTFWYFFKNSGTSETSGTWIALKTTKVFTEDGYLLIMFRKSSSGSITPSNYDANATINTSIAETLDYKIPHTELSVPYEIKDGYPTGSDFTTDHKARSLYFPCHSGVTYIASQTVSGGRFRIYYTTNESPFHGIVGIDSSNKEIYFVTAQENWTYILLYFYNSQSTSNTYDDVLASTSVKTYTCIDQFAREYINSDVVAIHKNDYYKASVFKKQRTSAEHYADAALAMIFFTDVHNDITRLKRFVDLANAWGSSYVNVAVNGGDITTTIYDATEISAYDTEIDKCNIPVLNTVGNHDAYQALNGTLEAKTTIYNAITAKVAENVPSIVQPENAATNGLNYYYYDKGSIRIIVLDCMYWNSDELSWFETILADAVTNSKAVIAVSHYSFVSTEVEYVDSIWNPISYDVGGSSSSPMNIAAAQAVKTFQDNGGEFIIWLCGHSHGDSIKKLKSEYGTQYQLICSSFVNRACTVLKNSDEKAYNYDCLTYLVVDTNYKIIRGMRIGANINNDGAEYHGFSINYGTGEFLHSY